MSVSIDVLLSLDSAERELNEFQTTMVNDLRKATESSEELFNRFADRSEEDLRKLALAAKREMEKVAQETKRAADKAQDELSHAIEESKQKWASGANELRGAIGDVGDAVGQLGKGLLGLSENAQLAADKTIYMTEKGMALGQAIGGLVGGPLGALAGSAIGAVGGGILGILSANSEVAAKKLTELTTVAYESEKASRELTRSIKALREQLAGVDAKGLTGAIKKLDIVEKEFETQSAKVTELQKEVEYEEKLAGIKEKGPGLTDTEIAQLQAKQRLLEEERKKLAMLDITRTQIQGTIKEANAQDLKDAEKGFKLKQDWNKKDYEDAKKTAKEKLDFAKNELESAQATIKTRTGVNVVTEAGKKAAKLKEEVEKLQAVYQNAATELESFGKSLSTNGKKKVQEATKEAKEFSKAVGEITDNVIKELEADAASFAAWANDGTNALKVYNDELERTAWLTSALALQTSEAARISKEEGGKAKEAAEIEAYANTVNSALDSIGQMSMSAIGGVATDAFNSWLEAVASGEKDAEKSFKKIASAAIRNIGQELVADGVKNILQGSANLITGRPAGGALVAIGGAEIAAGVGMGAAGARAQRRQGYGDENKTSSTSGTLGRSANANAGTQVQAPSIINLGLLAITDQRQLEQAGRQIAQAQSAYAQGRR